MFEVGDSKTLLSGNTWPVTLTAALNTATNPTTVWAQDDVGVAATGASYWASNIGTVLAGQSDNHTITLLNLGVNDFGIEGDPQWTIDIETVLDAIHIRWPGTTIYLMRPWKRGFDTDADTYAGYIANIVLARSFAQLGPDERVWLKGSDNGATNTTDGIHYSAAGEAACAAQWQTVLGY